MVTQKEKENAINNIVGRVEVAREALRDYGTHKKCGATISKKYEKICAELNALYTMLDLEGTKMNLDPRDIKYPTIHTR